MQAKQQLERKPFEKFFEENYVHLKSLALQITNYKHELSDDILHDFYVKLTERPPREMPLNMMGYAYISLRNSFNSAVKRSKRESHIITLDNEFLLNTLFDKDEIKEHEVNDQLRAICQYACFRKTNSISGSIFILRYFHGYFLEEVAQVVKRSRNAVEARLVSARREIKQFLLTTNATEFQDRLMRFENIKSPELYTDNIVTELRQTIFSIRQGYCRSEDDYRFIYQIGKKMPDVKILSHIVSCASCLDCINRILGLSGLISRHPFDSLNRQIHPLENHSEKNSVRLNLP